MDKRRYVPRNPRVKKTIHKIDADTTGNPALDGYTVRDREGYTPKRNPYFEEPCLPKGLMDENEARWGSYPTSIYEED